MSEQVQTRQRRKRRKVYDDAWVKTLQPRAQVYFVPDEGGPPGSGVRVYPTGRKSFTLVKRDIYGKQRWVALRATTEIGIEQARELAKQVIARLKEGKEPFPPPETKPESVAAVVAQWITLHVDKHKLRTGEEMKRMLAQHVLPVWRDRPFAEIKRKEVKALLTGIAAKHGDWISDAVMTLMRSVASWYIKFGGADDDYSNPFAGLERRVPKEARTRDRTLLSDDPTEGDPELRQVWHAAEQAETFGALVRMLLLTGQRLRKVSNMKWSDLNGNTWTIATEKREKGNAEVLRLPPQAMSIIQAQPRFANNPYVFPAVRNRAAISGFHQLKKRFDEQSGVTGYSLHDLRRTSRSLMARAGIEAHVAERVLGHAVGSSVQRIYERHSYQQEKDAALVTLANMIESIVTPPRPGLRLVAS